MSFIALVLFAKKYAFVHPELAEKSTERPLKNDSGGIALDIAKKERKTLKIMEYD